MIKNGVLLIVAGLFMAFIYPSFQTKLSGKALITAPVYQRSFDAKWVQLTVNLKEADNPIKLRLTGRFLPGSPYLKNSVSFKVKIVGEGKIVLDETVKLFLNPDNRDSGNENALETYVSHAPLFIISKSGNYVINVSMEGKIDFSLSEVLVTVLSNSTVPDTSFRIPGIIAMVFGLILFIRRRKSKRKRKAEPVETIAPAETPKPVEEPVKKKIRWGRNADKD